MSSPGHAWGQSVDKVWKHTGPCQVDTLHVGLVSDAVAAHHFKHRHTDDFHVQQ